MNRDQQATASQGGEHVGFDLVALETICKRFDLRKEWMKAAYVRLGVLAWDSERAVIRDARRKLAPSNRRDPALREARKDYYRAMLRLHADATKLAGLFLG